MSHKANIDKEAAGCAAVTRLSLAFYKEMQKGLDKVLWLRAILSETALQPNYLFNKIWSFESQEMVHLALKNLTEIHSLCDNLI